MSKEKNTMQTRKLNIQKLIEEAENIKKKKTETKDLYIKSLEGTITIKKPDKDVLLDSYDMENAFEGDRYLVYESVIEPNFKDPSLQEAYGVKGFDILDEIFDPGEVSEISKKIAAFAGYGNSVEEIKN